VPLSSIRAWSLLALCMGALLLGAAILPPAAVSPFTSHGAAVDRITLEQADLPLLGADGTRAELHAGTLGVEHLSLDDSLFTLQRGLVARDAVLRTGSGTSFRATTLELTANEGRHRWEGPATLEQQGTEVRFEGRGELWLEGGEVHVMESEPLRLQTPRFR